MLFFQRLRLLPVGGQYDDILNYTSPLHQYTHMAVVDAVVTGNWPVFWSSLEWSGRPCSTRSVKTIS
jgi:peptide/nickel transport system permease protein